MGEHRQDERSNLTGKNGRYQIPTDAVGLQNAVNMGIITAAIGKTL